MAIKKRIKGNDKWREQKNKNIVFVIRKKKIKHILLAVFGVGIMIGMIYMQTRKIDGTWVRVYDDNNLRGMTVQVDQINGVIVNPMSNIDQGLIFEQGEIKWKNIKKIGWGKYVIEDLTCNAETQKKGYVNSIVDVSINGRKMTLQVPPTEKIASGRYQVWEKQR